MKTLLKKITYPRSETFFH